MMYDDDIEVQVKVDIYNEVYGQDADGNRGELRTCCSIEEIIILEKVSNEVKEKIEKWVNEQDLYKYID